MVRKDDQRMRLSIAFVFVIALTSCKPNSKTLPVLSIASIEGEDTVFKECPPFSFANQNNEAITNSTFQGKVYVADFFFVSCPTICTIMAKNLKKV